MKKLLASVIVLILMFSCCLVGAMPASAAEGINYDDWLIFDGEIVEYVGSDANVVVPTVDADGLPITGIGTKCFAGTEAVNNETLEAVVIPEGIKKIGSQAFEFCTSLTEVSLPYSLEKADSATFRRCNSLTSLIIPGNLKEIPKDFIASNSGSLGNIVFSQGIEKIYPDAFGGLAAAEVIIPETVYEIGACAFNTIGKETGERMNIYITNDDCNIGVVTDDMIFESKSWGENAYGPFAELSVVPEKN